MATDPELYKFEGTLYPQNENKILVGSKQFLLRGSKLKNTRWVVGIVVYTGDDTKIMLSANESKFKQSNIERCTNILILGILILQIIVSTVSAIGASVFSAHY